MLIAVLSENSAFDKSFSTEHGLSLYIETNQKKILFDFGQSNVFLENAKNLGIDLSLVDFAVLSHGHYDHAGGLESFLSINKKAKVFVNRNAFSTFYNASEVDISANLNLVDSSRLTVTDDYYKIDDNIELFTCNQRLRVDDFSAFDLKVKCGNRLIVDDFSHEQYLKIKENEKSVLFSGCTHKGILNVSYWLPTSILIGGFHLMKIELDDKGKAVLKGIADVLKTRDTQFLTCHCTGSSQYEYLKNIMGEQIEDIKAGQVIKI